MSPTVPVTSNNRLPNTSKGAIDGIKGRIEIPNVDAIVLFRPITDHDVFPRLIIFTISRLLVICSCVVDRETPSTLSRPTVDR